MVEAGDVHPGDVVLEIGPGTGALTRALLHAGAHVIALETDARAVDILHETFQGDLVAGNLEVIHGDIRNITLSKLHSALQPEKYKVIANIPYYLSGFLFRTFLETDTQPNTIVFLVQKEVAERIARDPKESLLSLSVKVYGHPRYVQTIKPGNFTPPPKVDSAILAIDSISKQNFKNFDESTFFKLIHAGLKSKRKQLIANLSDDYLRSEVDTVFSSLGIRPDVRGEDLAIEMWLLIAEHLLLHKE